MNNQNHSPPRVDGPVGDPRPQALRRKRDHPRSVPSAQPRDATQKQRLESAYVRAFAEAVAALDDVTAAAMRPAAYRMSRQRALVFYERAAEVAHSEQRRHETRAVIDGLLRNLDADWRKVVEVEMRYEDDSTEYVHIKLDVEASRKFTDAVQFRIVSTECSSERSTHRTWVIFKPAWSSHLSNRQACVAGADARKGGRR